MREDFRLDDMTLTRIGYAAIAAALFLLLAFKPGIYDWAEQNPWLAIPPVIGFLMLGGWLFPGLGDSDDGIDFSD